MPKQVEECVQSVLDDNPDYSESRAYAICYAQENRDELGLSNDASHDEMLEAVHRSYDDPCWEGYEQVGMKEDENGNMVPNCVPEEDVENARLSAEPKRRFFRARTLGGAIERIEQSDGTVRYTNLSLLSPGKWTDSGSGETIYYSERGIANMEVTPDNTLNLMHDVDPSTGAVNPASDIGAIDAESASTNDKGELVADVVLHMKNAASEYADENLQAALESGGKVGFGGPSVEIPAEGQELERNGDVLELVQGKVDGAGLVMQPASKTVDFQNQTAEKGVALSAESEELARKTKGVYLQEDSMSDRTLQMDAEECRETLEEYGMDTSDMDDEEVVSMAEGLHDELMGMMDGEMGDYEDDEEEEEMDMGEEDKEDEDMDMDMEDGMGDGVAYIEEEIDDLWDKLRKIEDAMMDGQEMSARLSELADAETVQELQADLEAMDKQLSQGRTLADNGVNGEREDDYEPVYDDTPATTSRF